MFINLIKDEQKSGFVAGNCLLNPSPDNTPVQTANYTYIFVITYLLIFFRHLVIGMDMAMSKLLFIKTCKEKVYLTDHVVSYA